MSKPLHIVIDARWIFPEISGIGHYTRELLKALAVIDHESKYTLLFDNAAVCQRTVETAGLDKAANMTPHMLPYGVFSPRSQLQLPGWLRKSGCDLYHAPNYMIPLAAFPRHRRGHVAAVVTIHDVIPLIFPDHAPRSRKSRLYPLYRRIMLETAARADAIITVSRAAGQDMVHHLRIPPQDEPKVRAIYNGVSEHYTPAPLKPRRTADDPAPRTLLYVGRADPYKNLTALVECVAALQKKVAFPLSLTIAGSPDPRYPEAADRARELGIQERVHWTGYLHDAALMAIYREADALVHPSRYEGFGLQIVEAMACGTPVVCSRSGSLPEVAGDAALLFDHDQPARMLECVERVLTDPDCAAALREKGLARAATFTWRRTAETTLALYREVAAR